jgi:hypothetical protein
MTFVNLVRKQAKNLIFSFKSSAWEARLDRLIDICSESGGESSPYFETLQEHIKKDPKKCQNGFR